MIRSRTKYQMFVFREFSPLPNFDNRHCHCHGITRSRVDAASLGLDRAGARFMGSILPRLPVHRSQDCGGDTGCPGERHRLARREGESLVCGCVGRKGPEWMEGRDFQLLPRRMILARSVQVVFVLTHARTLYRSGDDGRTFNNVRKNMHDDTNPSDPSSKATAFDAPTTCLSQPPF